MTLIEGRDGQNDAASYLTEANSITVDNDGSGDRVVGAKMVRC